MSNFLIEYLSRRHQEPEPVPETTGPLLTISRDFGCKAKYIAGLLVERLNTYHQPIGAKRKWELINKEILELSARELQTESKHIEYVFNFEKRSAIDDFLLSLSSAQYQSDWKVREAIRKVIRSMAYTGNFVIVGRAGAQITRDLENTLHVRLVAPESWRIRQVMETYQTSEKNAIRKVREMDTNRKKLLREFSKDAECEYCYDAYFNLKYLTHHQVISDIIHLMQLKKLI